jgi:ketosteroid isomerase-like protein
VKAFREAIESWDFEAAEKLLADDVVFTSPVAFKPYPGKAITAAILRGVGRVFTDFRYQREIVEGNQSALIFEAKIGDTGVAVQGCDFITTNDDGLISEFTVMVRPLKGAQAMAEAMGAQFDQIQQEAIAAMSGADQ